MFGLVTTQLSQNIMTIQANTLLVRWNIKHEKTKKQRVYKMMLHE